MKRLLLALMLGTPAAGQSVLPDPAAVAQALDGHPAVDAANARRVAARAHARALAIGADAFTASASVNSRRVEGGQDFTEYEASLSRSVRLPGKARLDRRIGDAAVRAADNMADDARHQAALLLSDHWWEWLGAAGESRVLDAAVATLQQALAGVDRRHALRDAATMEVDQAQAALATARATARQAAGRTIAARAALAAQFPALPLPASAPAMPPPMPPPEGFTALGVLVARRSHEIAAVVAKAEMTAWQAERARQDRFADPSIGVRGFSEFGGAERGVGLMVSIPFSGRYRRAVADQAEADANANRAQAALVGRDIAALAARDVAMAQAGLAAWRDAQAAASAARAAADRAARGQALGGLDLAERLYAERLAQEAALAEVRARADAWQAITRLRIDSHTLWMHQDDDHDARTAAAPPAPVKH